MDIIYKRNKEVADKVKDEFGEYFNHISEIFINNHRDSGCRMGKCRETPGAVINLATVLRQKEKEKKIEIEVKKEELEYS